METHFSESENNGIAAIPVGALAVYSVGISTGGIAEMRMVDLNRDRHIIATTIDEAGADFAAQLIREKGFGEQIEVKIEDVAEPLAYADNQFDYIYARLVLHYLEKEKLAAALNELKRVLADDGKIFVVVRSVDCPDANRGDSSYDEVTGLTTCTVTNPDGSSYSYSRFFHTKESISRFVEASGLEITTVKQYDEKLFRDFMRTIPSDNVDNVIELQAVNHD